MKTFTFLTILLLTASFAVAGVTQGYLVRPADAPDPDARGTVKVKDRNGTGLFSVKLKKIDRRATYELWQRQERALVRDIEQGVQLWAPDLQEQQR